MIMFIFLIFSIAILSIFVEAAILYLTTKIFKIEGANYKNSLKIISLDFSISLLVAIIIYFIIPITVPEIVNSVLFATIFILIFKRYYLIKIKTLLLIIIVFTILSFVASIFIVLSVRSFLFQPFYVIGKAMEQTLKADDYTLIKMYNRNFYRGDIIVFKYPLNTKEYYIKRIIGLPGETVIIKDGRVYIKNDNKPEGFILDESSYTDEYTSKDTELVLKNNEYFVLGDNRDVSSDSRAWGAVKKDLIVGKYWFTAFSLE